MMTKAKIKKRVLPILGIIILTVTTLAFVATRKAAFPKPTGPYAVGSFQIELLDTSRRTQEAQDGRRLLVQLYYPAKEHLETMAYTSQPVLLEEDLQALYGVPKPLLRKITAAQVPVQMNADPVRDDQKFPLLIFSHGFNGTRFQNSFMLPELVSQGYIIASIEHTNASSGTVFGDGKHGQITPFDSLMFNESFSKRETMQWSQDQRFVLDQIKQMSLSGKLSFSNILDVDQVGVFGHSFGGATSAATLTEDERFLAGINMDGFYFGEAYQKGFEQPFMEIRADNKKPEAMSEKELQEWKFTREQYQDFLFEEWNRRIEGYARNGHESYTLYHSNHMSFSDFSMMMPFAFLTAPHREEHHRLTNHLVLDFFNRHLKHTASASVPEDLIKYLK